PQLKLALIPPGTFMMGSPPEEAERRENETLHVVSQPRAFLFGVYPVTRSQWWKFMRSNPTRFLRKKFPVNNVTHASSLEFCQRLATWTGQAMRLPTESEWEYACRAGTSTPFHFGTVLDGTQANCNHTYPTGTAKKRRHPGIMTTVGVFPPNA